MLVWWVFLKKKEKRKTKPNTLFYAPFPNGRNAVQTQTHPGPSAASRSGRPSPESPGRLPFGRKRDSSGPRADPSAVTPAEAPTARQTGSGPGNPAPAAETRAGPSGPAHRPRCRRRAGLTWGGLRRRLLTQPRSGAGPAPPLQHRGGRRGRGSFPLSEPPPGCRLRWPRGHVLSGAGSRAGSGGARPGSARPPPPLTRHGR